MKTDAERYAQNARNLLLGTFTTQELLEELKGRDGVTTLHVDNGFYIDTWHNIPDNVCCHDEGPATIIVVRGKE